MLRPVALMNEIDIVFFNSSSHRGLEVVSRPVKTGSSIVLAICVKAK